MPEGGGFSGVVLMGRFYHEDRAMWFPYYYADVGRAQYDMLCGLLGIEVDKRGLTEIHIYSAAGYVPLEDSVGQRLRFDGIAYAAESIYHRRDIVFNVMEISAE
jgi:hypothetical protein